MGALLWGAVETFVKAWLHPDYDDHLEAARAMASIVGAIIPWLLIAASFAIAHIPR